MKLRHILYASVYVKGKNQYHQFHDGILEIEDKEEIKELLKNQNIAEKADKKKGKQK